MQLTFIHYDKLTIQTSGNILKYAALSSEISLARSLNKMRSLTCGVCFLFRFRIWQDRRRRRLLMHVALYTPLSSLADCVAFSWDLLEDTVLRTTPYLKHTLPCLQLTFFFFSWIVLCFSFPLPVTVKNLRRHYFLNRLVCWLRCLLFCVTQGYTKCTVYL